MAILNNMQKFFKIAFVIIAISSFTACYYDKKDQVYPQVVVAACDTTNVTYSLTVAGILNANCNNLILTAPHLLNYPKYGLKCIFTDFNGNSCANQEMTYNHS